MIAPFSNIQMDGFWGSLGYILSALSGVAGVYYGTYRTKKKEAEASVEIERLKLHEKDNVDLKRYVEKLKREMDELHLIKVSYEKKLTTAKVTFKVVLNQMKRTTKDKDLVAMMEEVGVIFENM